MGSEKCIRVSHPFDRVISDFAAGAVEGMVRERGDHDLLFVEGQGALGHPAYSGVTLSILHGAQPDDLVLCHEAGRERVHSYESFAIPPVAEYADLYRRLSAPVSGATVVAGCLNTRSIDADGDAADAVEDYADRLAVPATDPVRFEADAVLDAVMAD